MTLPNMQTDKLARSLLAKQGVGAIWNLHQAAAAAHRAGFPQSANALIEIAEAAEQAWTSDGKRCLRGGLDNLIASVR
jgi:hypothetical protein